MADHLRKQTRDAVKTLLTGLTTTGANVFWGPVDPVERETLPALVIEGADEGVTNETREEPRIQERSFRLRIRAIAREAEEDLQDKLDLICLEVERVMGMPNTLPAKSTTLLGTKITLEGGYSKPVGEAALVYELSYNTAENAPDTAY